MDDTRSLASSIDALTNGIDKIKAEVAGSREAANEFTRIEQRLWQMASAAALEAVDVSQLLDRDIALMSRIDRIEAQLPLPQTSLADGAASAAETAITGALPDASPQPAAASETPVPVETAAVAEPAAKSEAAPAISPPRPRARAAARKRIDGWVVRNVEGDLALLDNNGTHYEVKAGDLLPRAGEVRAIKNQRNGWRVVTSRGVIIEAR
jgi:hypothetical protein